MKKIKTIFVALSSVALMASCGGPNAKFTTLSYKRVLSEFEKHALMEKVLFATFANLNKVEWESYNLATNQLTSKETQSKDTYTYYLKDEMDRTYISKIVEKKAGKEQKLEYTIESHRALYDEEKRLYAYSTIRSDDKTYYYQDEVYDEGQQAWGMMSDFENLYNLLYDSNMKAYEDKNGNNFFAYSNVSESNNLVNYGNSKKIYHKIQKVQRVFELNKDNSLKSMAEVTTVEENRDPSTADFYNKMKQTNSYKETMKFYYGDKAEASGKVVELRQIAKEGYNLSSNPQFKGYAYKEDGTEISSMNISTDSSKRVAFDKYHYVLRVNNLPAQLLGETVSTLKLKVSGNSANYSTDVPVAFDLECKIGSLAAGNTELSLVDGAIKMGKDSINLRVELDVQATAEGAVFSNVAAYAMVSFLS